MFARLSICMSTSKGKCKICGMTVSIGDSDMPPGIAAEGVMESIQEHIFQEHCNNDFDLIEGEYTKISNAWEYTS